MFNGREEFSDSTNTFRTFLALALWLGAIHFNVALILFAALFLPLSKCLLCVFYPSRIFFSFRFFFFLVQFLVEFLGFCLFQSVRFSVFVHGASYERTKQIWPKIVQVGFRFFIFTKYNSSFFLFFLMCVKNLLFCLFWYISGTYANTLAVTFPSRFM